MSRRQEALAAQAAGFKQFKSTYPCKVCNGIKFTAAGGGKCCTCHAAKARSRYSTKEGKEKADTAHHKYISTPNGLLKRRHSLRAGTRVYTKRNPNIVNANTAKRRAARLKRTPVWADLTAIKEFYKSCPAGYEVDHIIPLQGKLVSGLHVLSNLQYLLISDNRSKGNKFFI